MYRTMQEIEKEYDGNFVCIVNCKKDNFHGIIGGEVIAVSKNKMEVQEVWGKTPESFYQWIGEFPDAVAGYLF